MLLAPCRNYHKNASAFHKFLVNVDTDSVLFNPLELIRWNSEKTYLRELSAKGVAVTPTAYVDRSRVTLTSDADADVKALDKLRRNVLRERS